MKMMVIWMTSMMLVMVFIMATQLSQKKMMATKEKWSQFECGFSTMNPTHIPFSFQFFLVAILFLIFDVEISMILSYPLETKTPKNKTMLFIFLSILTIGLIYEWQKSKIDWSKWMG